MRHPTSCTACRTRKKRCIQRSFGSACQHCTNKRLQCDLFQSNPGRSAARNVDGGDLSHPAILLPAPSAASGNRVPTLARAMDVHQTPVNNELVQIYFAMFHNAQQIFFHQRTFLRRYERNELPDYLLLGLAALTARFSTHDYFQDIAPLERAAFYLDQALTAFDRRTQVVCMESLQATSLLSFVCFVEDRQEQSALLAAQSACMVQLLNIPIRPLDNAVERETDLRLFWCTWMTDVWKSTYNHRPRIMHAKPEYPKPLAEDDFESMDPDSFAPFESRIDAPRPRGIWSEVVEITETLASVVQTLQHLVDHPHAVNEMRQASERLAVRLDCWKQALPHHLQDTPENRKRCFQAGSGRIFAVLHLIFHYQCLILHFPHLCGAFEAETTNLAVTDNHESASYEGFQRCKAHARALSDLMWATNTTFGMECLWSPVNGHLLVVASAVHLYCLMFEGTLQDITRAKGLLEQNFVMLMQFRRYWPTVDRSAARLENIHKACERYGSPKVFQLDTWIFNFLTNYLTDLPDRGTAMSASEHAPQNALNGLASKAVDRSIYDFTLGNLGLEGSLTFGQSHEHSYV